MTAASVELRIRKTLEDPAVSYWLKSALQEALQRDPLDALNDAEALLELLKERFEEVVAATPDS